MAKRGRKAKKEDKQITNVELIRLSSGEVVDEVTYNAAHKDVGLMDEQIKGYPDLESLRLSISRMNPRVGMKVQPVPEPPKPKPPKELIDKTVVFEVCVKAGFSILSQRARREEDDIERYIRRHGISKIRTIRIERSFVADRNGNHISKVEILYKQEN
jgi:hypothetical protein